MMAIEVEVSLKIPRVTIRSANQPDQVIDNSATRFATLTSVPAIPKPGAVLELRTHDGPFECTVTRADWNEERSRFVLSCSYAKRSMAAADYDALVTDTAWTQKSLI
jgi:hypothetical protein